MLYHVAEVVKALQTFKITSEMVNPASAANQHHLLVYFLLFYSNKTGITSIFSLFLCPLVFNVESFLFCFLPLVFNVESFLTCFLALIYCLYASSPGVKQAYCWF